MVPNNPKIYHILHLDNLASIIKDGYLFSDALMQKKTLSTKVGMNHIKERRLTSSLSSYPDLMVGECVPFYFCPRSVMLYLLYRSNSPDLNYRGGQEPVIHLESNIQDATNWADRNQKRWAFTLSNAGSFYFEDRNDLSQLNEINWDAVQSNKWSGDFLEKKQAEFLTEDQFPWELVSTIGVINPQVYTQVSQILCKASYKPKLQCEPSWYY
jgi:hypothetical protein